MPQPFIGLTSQARNETDGFEIPANYIEAVYRGGGIPVVLAPIGRGQLAQDWLARLDGLVFTGGGDLSPALYSEEQHPATVRMNQDRDECEMSLMRLALEQGIPTLAICRGLQILNVALEGTLYQHLPETVGHIVIHRADDGEAVPHSSRIVPGSRLHSISGTDKINCMSRHHQGIKRLAARLKPSAYTEDNLIEAIEVDDHPWCFGVQWHPEMTAHDDPVQQRLFDSLVIAASQ